MGADFFSKNYDFGKAEIIVFKTALIYYTPLQLLIATKVNKLNALQIKQANKIVQYSDIHENFKNDTF